MTKYRPKRIICSNIKRGINKDLTKYDLFDKWCFHRKESSINSFYSFIQNEYWNVGFLKQYSLNTIDRVVLALPMNILSLYILYKIYNYFDISGLIKEFNFGKFFMNKTIYNDSILLKGHEHENHNCENKEGHGEIIYRKNVILNSFIIGGGINYLANFLILVLLAHPQINNRLLSGCPILYLFISDEVIDFLENNRDGNYKKGFAILLFFMTFSILGCIMEVGAYGFA
jgi:Gpi18-like mannosyltransferase